MVRRGHDAKAGSIIVLSADRPWGPQIRIPELSAQAPRTRTKLESVRRRAVLRVQCRTPGQRVAKNHHVRRQLCRPCSFPLSQNLAWRCTKQCNPVPNVRLFRAPPPKSTHPQLSRSFLYPSVFSKHPNEMGLVCVKTRAEQEPELGIFGATLDPLSRMLLTRMSNIGIGHGAVDAGFGYTYFNQKTGREFSGVLGFTYNMIK